MNIAAARFHTANISFDFFIVYETEILMKFFEVFKAGTYPQGTFTQEEVDALAQNYDPQFCEAPVTLDHEQKGPAYGWVSELKAENGKLKASFKDLSSELKEFVKSGKYKKISVEIYRNLDGKQPYLKAVSFLGASIPQVKGMSPVEFKEGEADTFIFETAGETGINPQENGKTTIIKSDSADNEDTFKKLAEAKETISKMQEQIAQMNVSIAKLENNASAYQEAQAELLKLRNEITQNKFEQFLNQKVNDGHLTPSQKDLSLKILMSLENVKQFSEQDSQVDAFKDLLNSLPKQIEFQEIVRKDKVSDAEEDAEKFANADEESLEIFKEAKALAQREGIPFKDALLKIKL